MLLSLATNASECLKVIGSDASPEDNIFMEHKNLNAYMSELSSSMLVPTYLSTSLVVLYFFFPSGAFPTFNQMWNTCKAVPDGIFQQLFNFSFLFKASAGHLSYITVPINW